MAYTEEYIIDELSKLKPYDIYNSAIVNYRGKSSSGRLYSEVTADYLNRNIHILENIKYHKRESSYKIGTHHSHINANSNRMEEIIAMEMKGNTYAYVGKILDYQIPLKNIQKDHYGKIDLISENQDSVYILELKKQDSVETLIRCILEAYTYFKIVDGDKMKADFGILPLTKELKKAVFIFKNSRQHSEYQNISPEVSMLRERLDVEVFVIASISNEGKMPNKPIIYSVQLP